MTGALDDRPDPRTSGTGAPPPHSLAVRTHGVRLPAPRQAHPAVPTGDTVVGIKERPLGAAVRRDASGQAGARRAWATVARRHARGRR